MSHAVSRPLGCALVGVTRGPAFLPALRFMGFMLFMAAYPLRISAAADGAEAPREPSERSPTMVSRDEMERVYEEVRTPHKYGVILRGAEKKAVDCPSVFRHEDRWYMIYIVFDGGGYETALAHSDDLLHWRPLGTILARREGTWDARQAAGYAALQDTTWGGPCTLRRHEGWCWLSYLGGALEGYETDPLAIGLAHTRDPSVPTGWTRLESNPVLQPQDPDTRWFETKTLYKSNVIRDPAARLGAPFVMFYNGKCATGERIGMAVSDDMVRWRRHGSEPLIDNGSGTSGDPQVVRIGDLWVMFYFGAFWKPNAFDTFACSHDLEHWTKWDGPHLVEPSEPWDATYAHKPWVLKWNGVVYHFYCAVGDEGRVIALATSADLKAGDADAVPRRGEDPHE